MIDANGLDPLQRPVTKRGRLKVYIGMSAGVGKTYRMLEEAHALLARGIDVVVGFIETHNYASLTSSRRTGDEKIGVIGYLRIAGRVFPFRSPGARRAGFGFTWRPDRGR